MREIKFRAWNGIRSKKNGAIGYFDLTQGEAEEDPYERGHANCVGFYAYHKSSYFKNWSWTYDPKDLDHVLMQYTGLKDKNGVEIYEGDLLFRRSENLASTTLKVVFQRGYFAVTADDTEFEPLFIHSHFAKVIGNIYENPELLEAKS